MNSEMTLLRREWHRILITGWKYLFLILTIGFFCLDLLFFLVLKTMNLNDFKDRKTSLSFKQISLILDEIHEYTKRVWNFPSSYSEVSRIGFTEFSSVHSIPTRRHSLMISDNARIKFIGGMMKTVVVELNLHLKNLYDLSGILDNTL